MAAAMAGSLPATGVRARPPVTSIEGASIPDVDYGKLLSLFSREHSAMLSDRHAAAIVRVCRVHEKGFPIRDLPMLQQVVRFAYDRVAEGKGAEFQEALCAVMRCAEREPRKEKKKKTSPPKECFCSVFILFRS